MDLTTRRMALMARVESGGRLPAEYQEVEYLEATGTQAFFTDVPIQDGLTVDSVQTIASGNDSYLFGGHSGKGFQCCFNGSWVNNIQSAYAGYYEWGSPVTMDNTTIYHIVLTQENGIQTGYKNDVQVLNGTKSTTSDTSAGAAAALFAQRGSNGAISLFYKGKVYSLKVLKGAELLANYVPCYRKEDFKPGMYDLVTGNFYINQGTGEFLYGANVN